MFWPEEVSVSTVPEHFIISPTDPASRTVGIECTVKTFGKIHKGKIAGHGKLDVLEMYQHLLGLVAGLPTKTLKPLISYYQTLSLTLYLTLPLT